MIGWNPPVAGDPGLVAVVAGVPGQPLGDWDGVFTVPGLGCTLVTGTTLVVGCWGQLLAGTIALVGLPWGTVAVAVRTSCRILLGSGTLRVSTRPAIVPVGPMPAFADA